jgi:hypothetical protein
LRTFPDKSFFQNIETIKKLTRVLTIFSRARLNLGYVAGMNFIAGVFLTQLSEDEMLSAILKLTKNLKFNFLTLHQEKQFVFAMFDVFDKLLTKKFPHIFDCLDKQGITLSLYSIW